MGNRIAIVGSGAIGSYYGAKLAQAGNDVHFLMRGDLNQVRRDGIFVRGEGENFRVNKIHCYNSTKEIGVCDLVVVAVKATSNSDLVDLIPPLLHERTMLLTLQNGLGNEEFLAEHFGAERVLGGLCFIAITRKSPTEVDRTAHGDIVLGEFGRKAQPRTHEIAAMFQGARVRCHVRDDLALERWRKLIWNIPFNGLSILAGGIDTRAILGNQHLRELTLALMNEVIVAANKWGHELASDAWREMIERTEGMGGYKPSTLVDWEAGKPLEIEPIWGEPVRRAVAAGGQMPRTEMIYELMRQLERTRSLAMKNRVHLAAPKISVRNLQRKVRVDVVDLEKFAARSVKLCLLERTRADSDLAQAREVSVLIVSDRRIASLHRRFMNESGPTDVITFQHGEILISAETARRNARRFGNSLKGELGLYIVHGLLHLHGFDDRTPAGARKMKGLQERILSQVSGLK